MGSTALSWLLCICIVQFLIIVSMLTKHRHIVVSPAVEVSKAEMMSSELAPVFSKANSEDNLAHDVEAVPSKVFDKPQLNPVKKIGGVAATLLLHAPTWFQRRYTMMIQNTISNIPDDWVVQIFYTTSGQSQHGLDISPGIKRFITSGVY